MMDTNSKIDLVLGAKYRVVKGDYSVVGTLTGLELDRPLKANGVTGFAHSYIDLTTEGDGWGDPYTARIYGPWDLVEQEMK